MEAESLPNSVALAAGVVRRRATIRVGPGILAAGVVLLAGLLRLYRFDALSLWVDEADTIADARLRWADVLGLHGAYEPHPPLYFALVKAASQFASEMIAGRLLSLIVGTLTIGLLYLWLARLGQPGIGLAAGMMLALAPEHIWYSQEARPYALATAFVAVAYFAVTMFAGTPRWRWAALYGAAVLAALYTEYSTVFALAPQIGLLILCVRRHGWRVLRLVAVGAAVALGYLPWLPQLFKWAHATSQAAWFVLSPTVVGNSLLSFSGLSGDTSYFWGTVPTAWEHWPDWQWAMVGLAGVVLILGSVALLRRSADLCLTAWSLLLGTPLVALLVSSVYPSYTDRTILPTTLGWAILVGAAISLWTGRGRRALTVAGVLGGAVVLALSVVTLSAIYMGAFKQQWRDLAATTAWVVPLRLPIVAYPTFAGVLLDLYQPQTLAGHHVTVADGDGLPPLAPAGSLRPAALWLSYIEILGSERPGAAAGVEVVRADLDAQGYQRLLRIYYPNPLYLDLYAQPGAALGQALPVNDQFAGDAPQAPGWQLPLTGTTILPAEGGGSELVLTNPRMQESQAVTTLPAQAGSLYTLDFAARAQLQAGRMRAFLICVAADGRFASVAPDGLGAAVPTDDPWHDVRIAALCPAGTQNVRIDLRNAGQGSVHFRAVGLQELRPAP